MFEPRVTCSRCPWSHQAASPRSGAAAEALAWDFAGHLRVEHAVPLRDALTAAAIRVYLAVQVYERPRARLGRATCV